MAESIILNDRMDFDHCAMSRMFAIVACSANLGCRFLLCADCKSVGVSHRGFESHRGLLHGTPVSGGR